MSGSPEAIPIPMDLAFGDVIVCDQEDHYVFKEYKLSPDYGEYALCVGGVCFKIRDGYRVVGGFAVRVMRKVSKGHVDADAEWLRRLEPDRGYIRDRLFRIAKRLEKSK